MLTEVDDEWLNYVQVHLEDKVRQSYSITYRKHSLSHAPIHSNHLTYTLNTYLLMYCSTLVGWSDFDSNHTVVLPGVRSVPIGAFHQIIVRLTGQPLVGQIDLLFHLCIISTLVGWSDWFSYSSSVHIYIHFFVRKWNHRCCGSGFRTKVCRLWNQWRFLQALWTKIGIIKRSRKHPLNHATIHSNNLTYASTPTWKEAVWEGEITPKIPIVWGRLRWLWIVSVWEAQE